MILQTNYQNAKCFYDLKSAYHQIPIKEFEREYTAFEGLGELYEFCVVPFGVTNGVPVFHRIMDEVLEEEDLFVTFPYMDKHDSGRYRPGRS